MLSDEDARQRWTSSVMSLHHSSSPAAAARLTGSHVCPPHAGYLPPPMTACGRPIADSTAGAFGGYRYMAEAAAYSTADAGTLHASSEPFRLPHDLWAESMTGAGKTVPLLTLVV